MEAIYNIEYNSGALQVFEDRLIIAQKKVAFMKSTEVSTTIYFKDITTIRFKKSGWSAGEFTIDYLGSTLKNIYGAPTIGRAKELGDKMEEAYLYISDKVNNKKVVNVVSEADELIKFKGLLDSGVITQEEFDAKKKQILGL